MLLKIKQNKINFTQTGNLKTTNIVGKINGMFILRITVYDIKSILNIFMVGNENFKYYFFVFKLKNKKLENGSKSSMNM